LLIVVLLISATLAFNDPFYRVLFLLQLLGYASVALVREVKWDKYLPKHANALIFFLTLNWAFLVAFVRFLRGRYSGSWNSTTRADIARRLGNEPPPS
jgi:hypothetical protein